MTAATDARVALLRQRLSGRGPARVIPARPDGAPPLSFAQERLWFMDQLAPESAAYQVPFPVRLRGALDVAALQAALDRVVARHEALRMRFPASADGRPTVVVEDALAVPLDIRVVDPALDQEQVAREILADVGAAPFDLNTGPLLRAVLIRLTDEEHVLFLAVHHIVFDGWSIDVFLRDLFTAYGGEPDASAPTRYGDYAAWQRERYQGERAARDLAYWREHLAGVPPLDLPLDRVRPPEQSFRGAGEPVRMGGELARGVAELARAHGTTAYTVLMAAYQVLLARHSGQDDFAIGSTVAGRSLPELERTVGLFANVLALRADLSGNPTFAQLLGRVHATVLDGFAHEEGQFDQIVSELRLPRDISRSPVFQATFTLLNYAQAETAPRGLRVEGTFAENRVTRFDLELYLYAPQGEISGFFTYNADIFDGATIARLGRHLERVLREVIADPQVRIGDLDLLDPAERELVLHGWNSTDLAIGPPLTLPAMVEAQVARTPDAVAVVHEDTTLTYRELDGQADALAHRLRAAGARAGTVVAVCAPRCPELVVALLAVVKTGAAYLPLDPQYPAERLAFLLQDAEARIVAVHGPAAQKLPDTDLTVLRLDNPELPAGAPAGPVEGGPGVDDVAYVIYTSGSTGRPKGVLNTHRGIHNRLDWMQRTYQLGADDVVLQKTPTGFDVSVWEFFWPLSTGARLVLARQGGERDAAYLRDAIIAHGVTTLHFVPSMLSVFLAEPGIEACTSLRRMICSGEELPVQLARTALERLPCELHNLYGPTEAAIDVSAWHCRGDELAGLARVPIGRPIQNIRLYLLDGAHRPVPPGVPGELHIAGVGVAKGYLNRPELTAQRFLPDPFGPPGSRMYATGDRARHRDDGAIEYLGRLDNQVKVRGVRIELGEIESALRDQPGVREAAVVVREDRPGDQRLTGYVVGPGVEPEKLRAALKATLPEYLVPAAFVALPALPVTANGKLDRRALPAPTSNRDPAAATPPGNDVEKAIAAVWSTVLGQDGLGIDDNFFDLGGHSLLATQVVARLRTALPEDCARASVMDLFKNPTIRELAALVSVPAAQRGPRFLLHELTRPVPAAQRIATLVCIPYGGGSAVVYQPLADVLPTGYRLFALAIPGHDVGIDEQHREFGDLAQACVDEILARIEGPVAVYGHCGVGGALAVAVCAGLERAGRHVEAMFAGAIFPFARPTGRVTAVRTRLERLRSDRAYTNWLTSLGVDLSDLEPAQVRTLMKSMRADSESAEEYFTGLMSGEPARLAAPVISVVGERDDMTGYYQERYREWHFLADTSALVVLDEAGHYFLKHRATELASILTGVLSSVATGTLVATPAEPDALDPPARTAEADQLVTPASPATSAAPQGIAGMPRRRRDATWWLHAVSRSAGIPLPEGPRPSMRRFLAVAAGQLASMAGSAMTEFAIPIWIYLHTHSLVRMALFSAVALVPGIVVLPFAGAVVDRYSRRAVMLVGDCAAGVVQACFLALVLSDRLRIGHLYVLLAALSVALTFQRLAYSSAVPQLVPKRYLGHANGVVQTASGVAQFLVPVVAAGLLATVGLGGIVGLDLASYAIVITVVAFTRFPPLLADKRRESVAAEIRTGFRYAIRRRGFPAMLVFFAATNVFLGPLFIMVQPLVLGFGTLSTVTKVAIAAALGGTAGGLVMAVWGGPARRRIAGMLGAALVIDAAAVVAGLRPALATVALGVFGMAFGLTVMNAIYATIVQVKVPARYHGRVFAVHTLFAWCTLPLGFVAVGPLVSDTLQPLVSPGGALAGNVGRVIGVGPARGIALTYLLFAVAMAVIAVLAWRYPSLRTFDRDVPDAEPDDLIGLGELRRRRLAAGEDGEEHTDAVHTGAVAA